MLHLHKKTTSTAEEIWRPIIKKRSPLFPLETTYKLLTYQTKYRTAYYLSSPSPRQLPITPHSRGPPYPNSNVCSAAVVWFIFCCACFYTSESKLWKKFFFAGRACRSVPSWSRIMMMKKNVDLLHGWEEGRVGLLQWWTEASRGKETTTKTLDCP